MRLGIKAMWRPLAAVVVLLWAASMTAYCAASAFSMPPSKGQTLTLSPANPVVIKGLTQSFKATVGNGDVTVAVKSWNSSNPAVATVDGSGHALALSAGTTTITATLGSMRATATLTVITVANPIFSVTPVTTPVAAAIAPAVQVLIQDNRGMPIAGLTVTMSIGTNGGQGGTGTLGGTSSQTTNASGVATFSNLTIDWLGTGYTLVATVTTPTGPLATTSGAFDETRVGDACLGLGTTGQGTTPECSVGTSCNACAAERGCANASGDGLNDAWKIAGGIDLNGDGIVSPSEQVLTNVDPLFPDGTPNPHPSATNKRRPSGRVR